ncbi:hypothetical protein STCU_11292 [Strigomonas culicis]|uniref:LSM domain-containing protein n=1 Tax=Strigomonas culicis TaxID=28005 RepID=S9TED5_9TRYP|nr:hypothetical protein STCU_11292 [Strigomonas culicis]|eukprot:EPY16417.1 hypothetical protein STCU_11292 [Strigomonas culicis]
MAAPATLAQNDLVAALAAGAGLHALVRVELRNHAIVVGKLVALDAQTGNLRLDAISATAVQRFGKPHLPTAGPTPQIAVEEEAQPLPLQCMSSIVIRGSSILFLDFISEEKSGGRGLQDVYEVAAIVRPS